MLINGYICAASARPQVPSLALLSPPFLTTTYIHTMLFAQILTFFAAAALCTEAKVYPKPDPNAIG